MLLVKTKLGLSGIEGIGLFADQFIPKGTIVWRWNERLDIRISAQELEFFMPLARESFLKYSYLSTRTGLYVLCFDHGRFINHSEKPNLEDDFLPDSEEAIDRAQRDIMPGEELTCDYRAFDGEALKKIAPPST